MKSNMTQATTKVLTANVPREVRRILVGEYEILDSIVYVLRHTRENR